MEKAESACEQGTGQSADRPGRLSRLIDYFMNPAIEASSVEERRKFRTFVAFSILMIPFGVLLGAVHFRTGNVAAAGVEWTAVVVCSSILPYMKRTGRYVAAGNVGISMLLLVLSVASWYGNGLEYGAVAFFPLVPVVALLALGRSYGQIWAVASSVAIVLMFVGDKVGLVPDPIDSPAKLAVMRMVDAVAAIGIAFGLAGAFNTLKDQALALVEARSKQIAELNGNLEQLFQNMRTGVLSILPDLRVHRQYSAYLEEVFEEPELAGRDALDLLFSRSTCSADSVSRSMATLTCVLGEDELFYDLNAHGLPTELEVVVNGRSKILELGWAPLVNSEGQVPRVLVDIRDVTEMRALQAEADARRDQLECIGHILAYPRDRVIEMLDSAEQMVKESEPLLEGCDGPLPSDHVHALFRHMHTIKGNARQLGFVALQEAAHLAEEHYSQLRDGVPEAPGLEALRDDLAAVRDVQRRYGELCQTLAGDQSGHETAEGALRLLENSLSDMETGRLAGDEGLAEILRSGLRDLREVPLSRLAAEFPETVADLSESLGKPVPRLEVEVGDLRLATEQVGVMRNVMGHLLRNALDHGIEAADERVRLGKPPEGLIRVTARSAGGKLALSLEDDGAGLDLDALVARAEVAEGEQVSAEQAADLIFQPGLSTAREVTDVSGRGVGMDAVRDFVHGAGGAVGLELGPSIGSPVAANDNRTLGRRSCRFVIELPAPDVEATAERLAS